MALTAASVNRLKAQLLTAGVQQENPPLYQIINLLIDGLRQSLSSIESLTGGSGGGSVLSQSFITKNDDQIALANSRQLIPGGGLQFNDDGQRLLLNAAFPIGLDGEDGTDGLTIVGPQGIRGLTGLTGSPGIDGEDGFDGVSGIQGIQGLAGPSGGQIYLPTSEEIEAIEQNQPLGNSYFPTFGQDVPFDAANFTASGTMAWGLTSPDQISYRWIVINGNIMVLVWDLETTSVTAPLSTDLRLKLPGAYLAAAAGVPGTHIYIDNGAATVIGYTRISTAGQNYIQMRKSDTSNWTASVNNTTTIGTAVLEVKLL